jgi:CBS domain-containing protein
MPGSSYQGIPGFLFIKLFVFPKTLRICPASWPAGDSMHIKAIMKKAITVRKDTVLKDAIQLMVSKGVGCLIVADGNKIEGILTERDALKQISKDIDNLNQSVSKFMTEDIITVDAKNDLEFAADIMTERKIKKLPVTENGKLVGIITSTDLIANADEIDDFSLF